MTTAMNQQSQPDKNFGLVTISSTSNQCLEPDLGDLNFVEQVIRNSTNSTPPPPPPPPPLTATTFNSQQCFMCLEWFKDDKELASHMAQHIELSSQDQDLKTTSKLEVLSPEDLEASLLVKADDPISQSILRTLISPSFSQPHKPTWRPLSLRCQTGQPAGRAKFADSNPRPRTSRERGKTTWP